MSFQRAPAMFAKRASDQREEISVARHLDTVIQEINVDDLDLTAIRI
jgi:hypothetical protein